MDVTARFAATDALSGVEGSASVNYTISSEGAKQSRTHTFTDLAGNTTTETIDNINIDKTPLTITGSRLPLANPLGWNNTDVSVSFVCGDLLSGVDGACGPNQTVSGEGAGQSRTGIVTDKAGNSASVTVGNISIDKTPPTLGATLNPAPNANGWNNTNVFQLNGSTITTMTRVVTTATTFAKTTGITVSPGGVPSRSPMRPETLSS